MLSSLQGQRVQVDARKRSSTIYSVIYTFNAAKEDTWRNNTSRLTATSRICCDYSRDVKPWLSFAGKIGRERIMDH